MEEKLALLDIGPAMLLNPKKSRPLSVSEWEELHEGVGYLHDEPWLKAGMRFADIVLASVTGLAIKRQRAPAIPKSGPELTRT